MGISIDDLEDDDILENGEGTQQQYQQTDDDYQTNNEPNNDFLTDFLRSKGINDITKIQFENEDGNIVERDWNTLTREEQINIANTPLEPVENYTNFDEEELNLINQIRNSGMTPNQYLQSIQGDQVIQEPQYKIDDLSDDELFLLDLESRVGELSEEEGIQALTNAKQNEEFYKKQIDGIRKEYKEREDYQSQQAQAELEEEQRQAFDLYQAQVVNAIDQFTSIGNLDLDFEDSDKEELAQFMLSQDENGNNYLYQALQDPVNLVKAAWFILNGDEAFDNVANYFKNQIKLISQNQYNKGLQDAQTRDSSKPQVFIDPSKNRVTPRQYKTIEDLDDED